MSNTEFPAEHLGIFLQIKWLWLREDFIDGRYFDIALNFPVLSTKEKNVFLNQGNCPIVHLIKFC